MGIRVPQFIAAKSVGEELWTDLETGKAVALYTMSDDLLNKITNELSDEIDELVDAQIAYYDEGNGKMCTALQQEIDLGFAWLLAFESESRARELGQSLRQRYEDRSGPPNKCRAKLPAYITRGNLIIPNFRRK